MTKPPQLRPASRAKPATLYAVTFQLGECANSCGVFSSKKVALDYIEANAVSLLMTCGVTEYGDELLELYQEVMGNIEQMHLVARDPFGGEEIWLDLAYREGADPMVQSAMFTITRHKLDDFGGAEREPSMPIIHEAPDRVQ